MSAPELKSLPGVSLFNMKDQVAVVTGGSKGLGAAMAAGLASAGASIVLVSRNADEAQTAAAEIADGLRQPAHRCASRICAILRCSHSPHQYSDVFHREFGRQTGL